MRTETNRVRLASSRHAIAVKLHGKDDPRTGQAWRELAAAKLACALNEARAAGLDPVDIAAVVRSGELPRTVAA